MKRIAPGGVVVLVALALAGASLVAFGHALRVDPQGWLRWGRELAAGGRPDASAYPSWKPLPLVLTVPLALIGSASPWLWLIFVRACGLLVPALLGRLAARRGGTAAAGAVAAALLAVAPAWWTTALGGGIEPVVVALGCAAVAAHERGRRGWAAAALALMALGREEALVPAVGYALVALRSPRLAVALAVALGAAWAGGDWWASGAPLHGGALARAALPETPLTHFSAAERVVALGLAPLTAALVAGGAAAGLRSRDAVVACVLAATAAWAAADLALLVAGYPVPARFLLPAEAGWALVGGVGAGAAWRARGGARASARHARITAAEPG